MHNQPFDQAPPPNNQGGPRTDIGKAISSRNATRHGCCSEDLLILPHENIDDYQALEATWFRAYTPEDDAEKRLVQQLVNADWFLERANRVVAQVEAQIFECGYLPLNWTDEQHQKLARFQRYQTARANAVTRARKALEDYRKNRTAEVIKIEKLEIYKEKNKPEPSIEELLQQMMDRKAERERQPPPDQS
jgi:hypothetical protein